MSIRKIVKDHLKEHAGVVLASPELPPPPDHEDPLKFWTLHETDNALIDLTVFAEGELEPPGNQRWAGPFSGRPALIRQLAPAIQATCKGLTKGSARGYTNSLRMWWRLLDAVEKDAADVGKSMDRVEDARSLTRMHCDYAHRRGMRLDVFCCFTKIVNATLTALRAPVLYWPRPENPEPIRHLPPEDQVKLIRIALKQDWEAVRRRWSQTDRVRAPGFEPKTKEDVNLVKHWKVLSKAQCATDMALPSRDQIATASGYKSTEAARLNLTTLRTLTFADRMEADIAFHLCLANTGWNPAVLYSLDASEEFLRTHPKNPNQYQLIGNKARAGGTEQFVSGLWKSTSGPGYIIKAWLERTASLRKQLVTNLEEQRAHYLNLIQQGASLDDQVTELAKVQRLEEGCRCVWLYVETGGDIGWLNQRTTNVLNLNGKRSTYLEILLDRLNRERIARGEPTIPSVTASDFRDIFALYVWRISSGNILAVKRALNHARLDTSVRYTSNNILNSERDEEVRTFLDHLFAELGQGRIDITILAHLQRYGKVTDEMEQRLTDYRALERSRVGVACKDPFNPPKSMQPESSISRICSRQRCLLCKEHAVILPESLPGIAMRMEELEAIKGATPAGDWFKSQFPDEFKNGQDVLRLFPADAVRAERLRWAQAISDGSHHVPGLNLVSNERGIT